MSHPLFPRRLPRRSFHFSCKYLPVVVRLSPFVLRPSSFARRPSSVVRRPPRSTLHALRLTLATFLIASTLGPPVAAHPADPKIAPSLLAQAEPGEETEFLVVLARQADLSAAAALPTKAEKGRFVYETLRRVALATQPPLRAWLQEQGIPHRAYYIVNAVWVRGDLDLARALALRADVARVDGNPQIAGLQASQFHGAAPAPGASPAPGANLAPAALEPNIAYTNADDVWALGFTGQGIVVGAQDTGYAWDHPALQSHYRGWDGLAANHDYNWHDSIHANSSSCGADSPAPCDDNSHGTHTLGTILGDDGGPNQIGMAPGAEWIGCRNMNEGIGSPATYLECFEFFLAPYPVGGDPLIDGDPTLAPDVTNNSWTCPPFEGCSTNTLLAAVQAQRAAGILTVVSAGNSGNPDPFIGCNTVDDPPALYAEVYTVGALATGTDDIAGFSSRGPVSEDGSNRRKPDITAPGTFVRSSVPGGGYNNFSGTSMAAPHVAGAVALLWSAVPELVGQISITEQILNESAVDIVDSDCGSSGSPNNTYGHGRLEVKAALDLATGMYGGVITGTVQHALQGSPISGASLTLARAGSGIYTTTSQADGFFMLAVLSGTYTLVASAPGLGPLTINGIAITTGVTTTQSVTLSPWPAYYLPILLDASTPSVANVTRTYR
jgi:subtilisin family serine protease